MPVWEDDFMPVSIEKFRLPRYREIPNVGLYLDQTVKYINPFLAPLGFSEVTPSMISNYVKKGYISNPVRKQYNADQIASLFFIAIAKNVVSMENIGRLFEMQESSYERPVAYDYFCAELENMLGYTFGLKDEMDDIGTTDTEQRKILQSVIIAVVHIIYLTSQFDAYTQEHAPALLPGGEGEIK